jgi:hypothetical protein
MSRRLWRSLVKREWSSRTSKDKVLVCPGGIASHNGEAVREGSSVRHESRMLRARCICKSSSEDVSFCATANTDARLLSPSLSSFGFHPDLTFLNQQSFPEHLRALDLTSIPAPLALSEPWLPQSLPQTSPTSSIFPRRCATASTTSPFMTQPSTSKQQRVMMNIRLATPQTSQSHLLLHVATSPTTSRSSLLSSSTLLSPSKPKDGKTFYLGIYLKYTSTECRFSKHPSNSSKPTSHP